MWSPFAESLRESFYPSFVFFAKGKKSTFPYGKVIPPGYLVAATTQGCPALKFTFCLYLSAGFNV